ncbi:MAG: hypothetical protein GEV28_10170 [Actinophytocola sp.]|nr:hypothetical protein [Actinophytocola sp.]
MVVGLVVGLVVGAGAVGLTWTLVGGGEADAGAPADAAAACAILDRNGSADLLETEDETPLRRFGAAVELAALAAGQDDRYRPLDEALQEARALLVERFESGEEFEAAVAKAKELCADL